ncbi:MAG: hypothetical protein R2875_04560 [Desulfobacterales bacterium]
MDNLRLKLIHGRLKHFGERRLVGVGQLAFNSMKKNPVGADINGHAGDEITIASSIPHTEKPAVSANAA